MLVCSFFFHWFEIVAFDWDPGNLIKFSKCVIKLESIIDVAVINIIIIKLCLIQILSYWSLLLLLCFIYSFMQQFASLAVSLFVLIFHTTHMGTVCCDQYTTFCSFIIFFNCLSLVRIVNSFFLFVLFCAKKIRQTFCLYMWSNSIVRCISWLAIHSATTDTSCKIMHYHQSEQSILYCIENT